MGKGMDNTYPVGNYSLSSFVLVYWIHAGLIKIRKAEGAEEWPQHKKDSDFTFTKVVCHTPPARDNASSTNSYKR
jgi:hypothetical protein